MTKKDYILQVFAALRGISPIADNLAILLEHVEIDDEVLDQIIALFKESIKTIKDKEVMQKAKRGLEILEKVKEMETESKKKDEEDIKKLDELLQAL